MMEAVNLKEKFGLFNEPWSPHILGEVNDSYVKIARFKGEFEWHSHAHEDEMFLVVKGSITIRLRDKDVHLSEGEFTVIPKGVEHLPVAREEAWVMMFEPKTTVNTGENIVSTRTKTELPKI